MEIRDPIHGLIKYDEKEEKLINSSIFRDYGELNS